MPSFHYKAIDVAGKKQVGFIEASHIQEAKEKLRGQGVCVLSLIDKQGIDFLKRKKGGELKGDHLVTITSQLSQLLGAGVPLYESLLSLEEQYREEKFHRTLLNLAEKIKEGSSLSSAMNFFPGSFSPLYVSMIAAGEASGTLDKTLDKLALLLGRELKLKKQLLTSLLYPLILACFSFAMIILLLTFVIPSLEMLFVDREVNRFTSLVMKMSHLLREGWIFYLPACFLLAASTIIFFKKKEGKLWFHRQLLHTPFLKTLIVQISLARFSRTMGTLLNGGVSIILALQASRKVMRNPFLEKVIEQAEKKIVEGSLLSQELRKEELIPPLVSRMLAIGEEGGNLPTMLYKIADLYEEEVERSLTRLTALAQPVILLIMGGIVGTIMMAVLIPLTDVNAFMQ